jgi:hypothetical protein
MNRIRNFNLTRFEDGKVVNPGASGAAAVPLPPSPDGDEERDPTGDEDGKGKDEDTGDGNETPPTAAWIASKIKAIIDSLPPLPGSSGTSPAPDKPPANGDRPIDPHSPTPMDSNLLKFLSTAAIMNGSISKGRQSVWSALERLQGPSQPTDVGRDDGREEDDDNDDQSIMMYAPLLPTATSKVEIANSHVAFVPVEDVNQPIEELNDRVQITKWPWPFGGWGGKENEKSPAPGGGPPPGNSPSDGKGKAPAQGPKKPQAVRRVTVWEPSTTNLSFQAMWWGYRL